MSTKEQLYAPFTDVKSRRGRGGVYEYISWKDVADRMNNIFGTNWSSEVMYQDVVENNVVVRVRVLVTDPESGKVHYQEGFGGAVNDTNAEAGNPFKSAYSKAFKDACKKWGVALFIEEETPGPSNMQTPPPGFQGYETAQPPAAPEAPAAPAAQPVLPAAPTGGLPTPPSVEMGQPPAAPAAPAAEPVAPTAPVPPAPPVEANPTPPSQVAPATPAPVQETAVPTQPAAPPAPPAAPATPPPPPAAPATPAPATGELPMSQYAMGGTSMISDVQRAALHSILQMQKIEYETLVAEAFQVNGITKSPLPTVDQLTYDEAVHVVKYGNDKFRKR